MNRRKRGELSVGQKRKRSERAPELERIDRQVARRAALALKNPAVAARLDQRDARAKARRQAFYAAMEVEADPNVVRVTNDDT